MHWQERMNRAITWIEQHLMEEGEWDGAARLSLAVLELASGDARIIDVALRFGYDSPDACAKVFRKLFGCTPTEARRPGARLRSYPPITFSVTLKGAHPIDYHLETKPAFSLTGLSLRTTSRDGQSFREIPDLWQRCLSDGSFARLRALVPPGSAIGVARVCAEFDMSTGEFGYVIAVETPADRAPLPPGCRDVAVPAATWGIFEARGPLPGSI